MIHIDRASVKPPAILSSRRAKKALEAAKEFFVRPLKSRRQEHFPFDPRIYCHPEVEFALEELFHGKCAYCEKKLTRILVDQFRPKAGAVGLEREYSPDHYWWLAYEWFNIYSVCDSCNSSKGPKFPVEGPRASLLVRKQELEMEQRLLLDPCSDNPEEHLAFDKDGRVMGLTQRGQVTVDLLNLNGDYLIAARSELARTLLNLTRELDLVHKQRSGLVLDPPRMRGIHGTLSSLIQQIVGDRSKDKVPPGPASFDDLAEAVRPSSPFSGMSQQLVTSWIGRNHSYLRIFLREDGAAFAAKPAARLPARKVKIATRQIESISVHNFKAISDLRLKFPPGSQGATPWLMILGENATGKSSILQAVALALMGETRRNKLGVTPTSVLRRGTQTGYVKLRLSGDPSDVELQFSAGSRKFVSQPAEPNILLLGYGATRLLPRAHERGPRSVGPVRVENLFNPFIPLIDARWLRRLRKPSFDYAARAIKDVLSLARRARIVSAPDREEGILVSMFGKKVPLDALSDGYQSVIGLTADLIKGLRAEHKGGLEAAEGIVLLDEMGAHLHPRWRMRIVSSLREAFPRVQFLATTHDPLCLRGLTDGEVVVLRRSDRGRVFNIEDLPPVKGLRVDQLLTSEYFGLNSTMDPETEADFNEYYRLLALRNPSPAEQTKLGALRLKVAGIMLPGITRRERLMLQQIDKYLARTESEPNPAVREAERSANATALERLSDHAVAGTNGGGKHVSTTSGARRSKRK